MRGSIFIGAHRYIYIYIIHKRNAIKNYTRRFLNEIGNVLRDNVYVATHAFSHDF